MRQLIIAVLVFFVVLWVPFGAKAQAEEKNQDSCSAACDAEFEICINKPGSLFSRTRAQIDSAEACYIGCSRDEGDALDACQKRKYSCWQEILDRKNPDGTWQCMYAGSIEYIRPACKTEGEAKCDGPREVCIENGGKAEKDCSDRCSALESEQTSKASPEFCREQKTACLVKNEACQVEALVEKAPAESDLSISENAKRLDEELRALFGEMEFGNLPPQPKVPEITGDTPYLFDNPLSTKDNRYFSFTADAKNHIIEFRGGNKVTLEFPDGTTFVPEAGDFVRVPVGTRVKTEMGLYQGVSPYDNIGKFGTSSLGITNVAGGSSITLGGGSVVELVSAASGGSSNVKLKNGVVRIGTGGFGVTDRPDLPTEILFEGRQDVEISWDGTDFAVSFDRETGKIIVEIYDGTIKVAAGEKKYSLSSSYGGEIKRIEIGKDGEAAEKIAVLRAVWQERPKEEPRKTVSAEVRPRDKQSRRWSLLVMGVIGLIVVGGLVGYRKRHGTWPFEARWKPVVNRLREISILVIGRLKRK